MSSIQPGTGPCALIEPIVVAADAATSIFNLPDYRVISATVLDDRRRRVIVESDQPPGCPSCGVLATRRKERRFQRIRDFPVAGAVEASGPSTAGTARNPPVRGSRSSNPPPRSRAVPGPRHGSGTKSLMRSSIPAGPCPRRPWRSRCPGGWCVPH